MDVEMNEINNKCNMNNCNRDSNIRTFHGEYCMLCWRKVKGYYKHYKSANIKKLK